MCREVVQAKDFEDWLDRCNTEPSIVATVDEYAKRDFTGIVDGLGEPSQESEKVSCILRVERLAVKFNFPSLCRFLCSSSKLPSRLSAVES